MTELTWSIVTADDFPDGITCPVCGIVIGEGKPYGSTPIGMTPAGQTMSILTCVYCEGEQP